MKKLLCIAVACGSAATAQIGRTLDWVSFGGDAQRTGWEKSDARFTKEQVAKEFRFLWKAKPPGEPGHTLMPPVIVGTLVGYRGFKELAFFAGSDDTMHVMDADLDRTYWSTRMPYSADQPKARASATCPGGLTAMPALMAISFRRRPTPPPAGAAAPATPPRPTPNPAFAPRAVYAISSDGKLRRLNISNGVDFVPPAPVVPPNAKVSPLNMNDNVIYTTTSKGCGDAPNAVWAIDISNPDQPVPVVKSFVSGGGSFGGVGGPVIGTDGTVYVRAGDGPSDPAANKFSNALLALTPKDLKVKGYFVDPSKPSKPGANVVTPVVFAYKEKEMVVTAGNDGRLLLLEAENLRNGPIFATAPVVSPAGSLWGGLSSWAEADGTRWVLATVWGGLNKDLKATNGEVRNGAVVAFKLVENDGKPELQPAWVSQDLVKPTPPVIANGVVFALANGDSSAVLYALDGANGKQLWSTGKEVTSPGALTGLTVANGRAYFATKDGTIWTFGVPLEW